MSANKPRSFSKVRALFYSVFFAISLWVLCSSLALGQGSLDIRWFDNPITDIQQAIFSSDGKLIADSGSGFSSALELRDGSTGQLLQSLPTNIETIVAIAFSPDNTTLLAAGFYHSAPGIRQGLVERWDVSTGQRTKTVYSTAPGYNSLLFSPDTTKLVVSSMIPDGQDLSPDVLELWDAPTGNVQVLNTKTSSVNSVAFSADGTTLVDGGRYVDSAGNTRGAVELWTVATAKFLYSLSTEATEVFAVKFSPDGTTLAVGGEHASTDASGNAYSQGVLELWNVSTRRLLFSLRTVADSVHSVAFSPNGKTLANNGNYKNNQGQTYGTLESWNLSSEKLNYLLKSPGSKFFTLVTFSPDGKTVANTGVEIMELRNATSGKLLHTFKPYVNLDDSVVFSPNGKILLDAGTIPYYTFDQGHFNLWNVATGKTIQSFQTSSGLSVASLAFSANGKELAGAVYDPNFGNGIVTWNVSSGAVEQKLKSSADNGVTSLAYSPDGKLIVDGGEYSSTANPNDGDLELWNVATGKLKRTLKVTANYGPTIVAFSPDGTELADGGAYQGTSPTVSTVLELWNVAPEKFIKSFNSNIYGISTLAFSQDGKMLADGGYGGAEVWDVATEKLLQSVWIDFVSMVRFSPDGKRLAVGGYYKDSGSHSHGIVELLDATTGQFVQFLDTTVQSSPILAFSPDGKMLAVGGYDGAGGVLELWQVGTGALYYTYDQFVNIIDSLAFSPTGEYIAYSAHGTFVPYGGFRVLADNPVYTPPILQSVTLAVTSVKGGTSTTGAVTLSGPAPTLGATVSLTSSNTALVTVPAAITLPSVQKSGAFIVTTKKVTAKTTVTITATRGIFTKEVLLTLTP